MRRALYPFFIDGIASDATTNPMICVSSADGARVAGDDLAELRLDLCRGIPDFLKLPDRKRLVVSCRASRDQGLRHLLTAARAGVGYVDIDLAAGRKAIAALGAACRADGTKLIVSYHDFHGTPRNLDRVYDSLKKSGADILKTAVMARRIEDNLIVFRILERARREHVKLAAFCMGDLGRMSRILYKRFGGAMTYACRDSLQPTAPGQLTVQELLEFGANRLNRRAKIFGVVGAPDLRSASPRMFNAAYRKLSLNMVYLPFPASDIGSFVKNFRDLLAGFSVTMPHKESVSAHLDGLHETARNIGAVNTVVKRGSKLIGYNTDCTGVITAIRRKSSLKGKKVLVLGAGGFAKAAAYGATLEHAQVCICSRKPEAGRSLARRLGGDYRPWTCDVALDFDIVINCTPLGMRGEPVLKRLPKNGLIVDAAYRLAGPTPIIKTAKTSGLRFVSGEEILVAQALEQFRLWTGRKAPRLSV
jgi:3-dehydroquinate dehydratase/shikimate dehydrogenase